MEIIGDEDTRAVSGVVEIKTGLEQVLESKSAFLSFLPSSSTSMWLWKVMEKLVLTDMVTSTQLLLSCVIEKGTEALY